MSLDVDLYIDVDVDVGTDKPHRVFLYTFNITHNLAKMAHSCGLHDYMWAIEELGFKNAKDLIEGLEEGVKELKARPEFYSKYNPKNHWGDYEDLVNVASEFLEACKSFPKASISVSR